MLKTRYVALAAAVIAVLLSGAAAQASDSTLSRLGAAHDRIMENPAKLEFLYDYAEQAIYLGNYEAAIGALESILIIAGNQPRLLLQIGTLYQRLGSPRTANFYLKLAQKYADADSDISVEAQRFRNTISRETSDHVLFGFARLGLRYQTNPSLAPETDEILSGGFSIPTPKAREPEEDVNAFLLSRIEHNYSLNQRVSTVTDALIYATAYNDQDQLNYRILELSTGLEYESPANASGQYGAHPYLLYRASRLKGFVSESTPGVGLELSLRPGANSRLRADYQYRDRDIKDVDGIGSAELRSGDEQRLDLRYRWEFLPGHALAARIFGRTNQAQEDYFESDEWGINLRYSVRCSNFLFENRPRMTLTPFVTHVSRKFGAPDPDIAPSTTRNDKEWSAGLSYQVPFTASWTLFMNYEHSEVDSNIVNFDTDNDLIAVGVQTVY